MSNANLSATKQALLNIQKLQARLDRLERERTEPIAIVGIGCRFPGGADGPDAYWDVLRNGVDAIGEVPAARWSAEEYHHADPDAPGKTYTTRGGFLPVVDEFDPQFFGIAPREAIQLDPQQRLLLEVAWESLEHANIAHNELRHSATGVFVGIISMEYGSHALWSGDTRRIDAYSGTGSSLSVAAGRLSYVLGLNGPCMALDGLFVVVAGRASGLPEPAPGRVLDGPGRRRQPDARSGAARQFLKGPHALAGRALQDL